MKKVTSILLFLALCLSASAQSTDSTSAATKKFNRWTINIHVAPAYSFRTLKPENQYILSSYIVHDKNAREYPMIGYTAGIGIAYSLKKQLALQLGLNYSKKKYGSNARDFNYAYVEIPLKVKFLSGKKNVRFLASAGLTGAYLVKQDLARAFAPASYNAKVQSFNLFAAAGAGIDIKLGRAGIQLEPTYSYGMLKTVKAPASEHLWQAGLDIGLSYALSSYGLPAKHIRHQASKRDSASARDFKRFAIGVHFSAGYSYRIFDGANPDFFTAQGYNGYLVDDEIPMVGLETGVKALWYIKKQFALEAGISYSRQGYAHVIPPQDTSDDPAVPYATKSVYNYLEIPLKAHLILGRKKTRFIASAGLSPAFLASKKAILDVGSRAVSTMHIPFNLFATAAAGVEFGLSERLAIQLQPGYRYGIINTKDEGLSTKKFEHLWQIGMDAGLTYKF